jgi:WhiB family redox-sensing transcriptional regulator
MSDDFESIDESRRPRPEAEGDVVVHLGLVPPLRDPAPAAPATSRDDVVEDALEDDGADEDTAFDADGRPELSLVDMTGGLTGLSGLTPEDPGWAELALCAQTDPEAFFPEKGGSTREAKRVCLSCEVRQECLEYALANDERFGIWGGLSERERRRLKRHIG